MVHDDTNTGTITSLLSAVGEGSRPAYEQLFEHVQSDLKRLAQSMINARGWRSGPMQGTELVNMACARILGKGPLRAEDRRHLFFLLGRAMRDVLVEEARRASAAIHGGGHVRVAEREIVADDGVTCFRILDLHDALDEFKLVDPAAAALVELRFFAGRTLREAADAQGVSFAVARRNWEYAKAWLGVRLGK